MKEQSRIEETLRYLNGSKMSMLILWLYTLAQALSNEMWLWKRRSHSQQLEGVESVKHSFGQIGDLVSIQNPEHRRDSQQKSKHTHQRSTQRHPRTDRSIVTVLELTNIKIYNVLAWFTLEISGIETCHFSRTFFLHQSDSSLKN